MKEANIVHPDTHEAVICNIDKMMQTGLELTNQVLFITSTWIKIDYNAVRFNLNLRKTTNL